MVPNEKRTNRRREIEKDMNKSKKTINWKELAMLFIFWPCVLVKFIVGFDTNAGDKAEFITAILIILAIAVGVSHLIANIILAI